MGFTTTSGNETRRHPGGRPVIIDTDWYTDVDDVVAMRLASYYERAGDINILACIVDTVAPDGAPSLDTFWRTENRPMVIGQVSGTYSDLAGVGPYQAGLLTLRPAAQTAAAYPTAVTVYRTQLAAADDGTVDIISIGYLSALWALLLSPADGIDSRTGVELVTAKVRRLYVMGGTYPTGTENNFNRSPKARTAAAYVVANWPTTVPIYFSGFEVGDTVLTGDNLRYAVPATDPLYAAMVAYGSSVTTLGRSSWDPMTVALAANGDPTAAGYSTTRGTNVVNASTGANTFTPGAGGPHYYLTKVASDATFKDAINARLIPDAKPATLTQQSGTTDISALVASFDANDISGSDGDAIASASGTNTIPTWTQSITAAKPTLRTAVGGKKCLQFDGGDWLETVSVASPSAAMTVHAVVRFATVPTSNQTAIADDSAGTTTADRSWHLKVINAGVINAVAYWSNGAVSTAVVDAEAGPVVQNTWHVLSLRKQTGTVEAFLDGVSAGSSAISSPLSVVRQTIHIGGVKHPSNVLAEGLVGYLYKAQVWSGARSNAQITADVTALLA